MIITIDGPAASGKSTAARELARELRLPVLDTGATYRTVALACLRAGVEPSENSAVAEIARSIDLQMSCDPLDPRVMLGTEDVTDEIRAVRVEEATKTVCQIEAVREILIERQREIAAKLGGSLVAEGRDQGAVVFPEAEHKFILDAEVQTRAIRRGQGEGIIGARDAGDEHRFAELKLPGNAISVDTTDMSLGQVVEELLSHVRA